MQIENFAHKLKHPVFKVVSQIISEKGLEAYVIGGFVRDLLLERPSKDIDIVVVGNGMELAQAAGDKLRVKRVNLFKNFGTAQFNYKDLDVEFVGARKESYQRDSRKPIVEDGTLSDDQKRRDFTINALALDLRAESFGNLIDPFNGLADLEKGILRTPLDPNTTYSDDPLRMMRAIRFATQLDFQIEISSLKSILENSSRLEIISQERIVDELNKIILAEKPSRGFELLNSTKLLHQFFPEMIALHGTETRDGKSHKDNFYHTLEVLDNVAQHSDNLWLRWGAILHDIAKPPTKRFDSQVGWTFHGHEELGARMVPKIFTRLRLPLDAKMKYVQKLVRLHLRPISLVKSNVTDSAIRRLLFEAGDDIDDLMTLCNADITSKNEFKVKKYKKNFELVIEKLKAVEEKDHVRNFQPPISGDLIMKTFNLKPCGEIGIIKAKIKEAILEGEIPNDFEIAKELMFKIGEDIGLKINVE
ncbi:CCA tRNA nucleotidyltransferase [Fluviicola taffensis]|uniref:Polynucleotide adenylyltransferase/metal dependent phosphohydrolase n=1 Tax=Fluviicola taffensis (strain DSM 16823 / NCIMB 13979 / RW262) TaxID=755732 RepID=F2IH42_FLUTR|nr:HD domain-containing protein [Fluviicola taffensis]AEA45856.1 polynucleotide adenylyltransferase/metal dependent phosphohydrolase [Fluviicola taffensis DSM 16823]